MQKNLLASKMRQSRGTLKQTGRDGITKPELHLRLQTELLGDLDRLFLLSLQMLLNCASWLCVTWQSHRSTYILSGFIELVDAYFRAPKP